MVEKSPGWQPRGPCRCIRPRLLARPPPLHLRHLPLALQGPTVPSSVPPEREPPGDVRRVVRGIHALTVMEARCSGRRGFHTDFGVLAEGGGPGKRRPFRLKFRGSTYLANPVADHSGQLNACEVFFGNYMYQACRIPLQRNRCLFLQKPAPILRCPAHHCTIDLRRGAGRSRPRPSRCHHRASTAFTLPTDPMSPAPARKSYSSASK